jgi:hypothetical protein
MDFHSSICRKGVVLSAARGQSYGLICSARSVLWFNLPFPMLLGFFQLCVIPQLQFASRILMEETKIKCYLETLFTYLIWSCFTSLKLYAFRFTFWIVRNACRRLVGRCEGKKLLEWSKPKQLVNYKMDLREMVCGSLDWINLAMIMDLLGRLL